MTQEQKQQRNYFDLGRGLNSERNEINFPEGFTTDEANYEILRDGSRRRRKGLALEEGGSTNEVDSMTGAERCQTYVWKDVGGDPSVTFCVVRIGGGIFFTQAGETLSAGWQSGTSKSLSLDPFWSDGATTANVNNAPVTFSSGRGRLLVSGQYVLPFYVDYDASAGTFKATAVNIRCRDFTTIEDGTGVDNEPTSLDADHKYNLRNRGWPSDKITTFESTNSKYPARNSIWWKGFKRTYGANIEEASGTRSWDEAKLAVEGFGLSSAPRGSLFLNPTDTTLGITSGSTTGSSQVNISTWTVNMFPGYWEVIMTTDANHNINVGDTFTIEGNSWIAIFEISYRDMRLSLTFNGTRTATTGTSGTDLRFTYYPPPNFQSWEEQYNTLGTAGTGGTADTLDRSSGTAHNDSWSAVAWHAGRAWYAGMLNAEWNDTIFFSQIVDDPAKYGKCFQEADPTDENYNALVGSDGGTIVIPGMGGVVAMHPLRDALLVFGRDGVWAIESGQGGFTPTNFRVRKLIEAGCSSPDGIVIIENTCIYTGPGGVFIIAPNQYTSVLEAQNFIRDTVQSLWSAVPTTSQEKTQAKYDDAQRRIYFMFPSDATTSGIDTMFVLALDQAAWFKYTFNANANAYLLTALALPEADDPTENKKMKFIYQAGSASVGVADFDQTTFNDWDGSNGPLPYMITGWSNLQEFQRAKQAPIITVFSKRTETGYTGDELSGYAPVNESSTLMSGYWDWVDKTDTGKITGTQQVYRHRRQWVPSSTTDLDGEPVIRTRNKLRGRGRVLQLKFEGETDKDSHILGFTTNYKVTRKV